MKNILTLLIIFISSASFGQDNGELLYNLVVKNDTEQSIKLISENANVKLCQRIWNGQSQCVDYSDK